MNSALSGIRVLEMANVISGPYAAMLLADMGADVIKIEAPGSGDVFRVWEGEQNQVAPTFAAFNRGKRSVTIDAHIAAGQEAYLRLAQSVDVVIENFRPGVLEKFNIGYERVKQDNPAVVYCSITGMGSTGQYRGRPTYDAIAQAVSGLWSQFTDLQNPEAVGPATCDQLTGMFAAHGILASLVRRSRDGLGQRLEVSMLGAALAFQTVAVADYTMAGRVADRRSRARRSQSYAFLASDDLPIAVHLSTPPKFWKGLLDSLGKTELLDDPRFATKSQRIINYDQLHEILQAVFGTRTRAEWLAVLHANDVPAGPINTIAEAIDDAQVQASGLIRSFGKEGRACKLVSIPVVFADAFEASAAPPPRIGEHTDEILTNLGYSRQDIKKLRREGAI